MARRARELDTVEFVGGVHGWPSGTVGAVIAEYSETALVEISTESRVDEDGFPSRELLDDLITVSYDSLHVIEPAAATAG